MAATVNIDRTIAWELQEGTEQVLEEETQPVGTDPTIQLEAHQERIGLAFGTEEHREDMGQMPETGKVLQRTDQELEVATVPDHND